MTKAGKNTKRFGVFILLFNHKQKGLKMTDTANMHFEMRRKIECCKEALEQILSLLDVDDTSNIAIVAQDALNFINKKS